MSDFVLMYHRVCDRHPATEPWFARGTAVTPRALRGHLEWLREHYEIVPLDALCTEPGARRRAAITFDDGYAELASIADPICRSLDVPATCFASAGPAIDREPLWFDAWYALVATGPAAAVRSMLAAWGAPVADDPSDWITGPPRHWLGRLSTEARARKLGELLAEVPARVPEYLSAEDLRSMRRRGWMVGGHGARHPRLTDVADVELTREIERSVDLLEQVGAPPTMFAYPDGAHDDRVAKRVGAAGFHIACTVERGPVEPDTPSLRVPRLFCRGERELPHHALEVAA